MTVHYYGIQNCRLEDWNGEAVLIAPSDASYVLLNQRCFRQAPQGEWVYKLTAEEAERVRSHEANHPDAPLIFGENPQDADEAQNAERLCKITRRLLILTPISPFPFMILMVYLDLPFAATLTVIIMLYLLFLIAAFVTAIYNHTRHPSSVKASEELNKMIIGLVLGLIFVPLTWLACDAGCNQAKEDWNSNFTRSCTCCQIK